MPSDAPLRWLTAGLAALLALPAWGARYAHPDRSWFTLEGPHFLVHYPAGLDAQARRFLDAAERQRREIETRFDWRPREKTAIVVTDYSDYANGWATPLPRNRILVHLARPDDILGLEDFGDWPELLIRHEYVHTVHLDKVADFSRDLRGLLGRNPLLFPNLYQPRWITEGIATDLESKDHGRGQSSYFRALMRLEARNGPKSYRQLAQPFASWPGGAAPYLYGVEMVRHLRRHHGEAAIQALIERTSAQPLPFLVGLNFRPSFGHDLATLWNEFSLEIQRRSARETQAVYRAGHVAGTRLTEWGFFTGQPRVGEDGLWLIRDDQIRPKTLMHRDRQGRWRAVAEVYGRVRLDVHPQAGVLVSQLTVGDSVLLHQDLFHLSPQGRLRRLTHGGRYRHAAWSPDGRRIAAVSQHGGRSRLELLDNQGRRLETLWQGREAVLGAVDFSPDGRHLAAALWRPECGCWDLARIEIESRRWELLTDDDAIQAHPRYGPDGSLFYSADHGGRYDIHRLPPEGGRRERLTRVIGAAFQPEYDPHNDTLYYVGLSESGQQIFALEHPRPLETHPLPAPRPWTEPPAPPVRDLATAAKPYDPWPRLRPAFWLPLWEITPGRNLIGAALSGGDDLDRHRYDLSLAFDSRQGVGDYALGYQYEKGFVQWRLGAGRSHQSYQDTQGRIIQLRADQRLRLEALRPWRHTDRNLTLGLAVQTQRQWNLRADVAGHPNSRSRLLGAGLNWRSTRRQALSLIGYHGHDIRLSTEAMEQDGQRGGRLRSHLQWTSPPVYGRHALRAEAVVARSFGRITPFELGGYDPELSMPGPFTYGRYRYPLPGQRIGRGSERGDRLQLLQLAWHFPLSEVERGWMLPPLGLQRLHGRLFSIAGRTWFSGEPQPEWKKSAGIELNLDTYVGFQIPLKVKIGWAVGSGPQASQDWYLDWQLPLW